MKTKIVKLAELAKMLEENPKLKVRNKHVSNWLTGYEILDGTSAEVIKGNFEVQIETEVYEFESEWLWSGDDEGVVYPEGPCGEVLSKRGGFCHLVRKKTRVRIEVIDE